MLTTIDYQKCGASQYTFHLEAVDGVDAAVDLVQKIGEAGMLGRVLDNKFIKSLFKIF